MVKRGVIILLFPFVLVLFSVRLAFTEFFIEWEYSKEDFPEDRWGLSKDVRLNIAKLGLRAVLSQQGMREFKASGFFSSREIKHMEDVKRFLSIIFPAFYLLSAILFTLLISLGSLKEIGRVLMLGGFLVDVIAFVFFSLSLIDYNWLFVSFHNLVFDPYSWRFRDEDMLLRVYPMKFWFDATIFVIVLTLISAAVLQTVGFLLIKINRNRLRA